MCKGVKVSKFYNITDVEMCFIKKICDFLIKQGKIKNFLFYPFIL